MIGSRCPSGRRLLRARQLRDCPRAAYKAALFGYRASDINQDGFLRWRWRRRISGQRRVYRYAGRFRARIEQQRAAQDEGNSQYQEEDSRRGRRR